MSPWYLQSSWKDLYSFLCIIHLRRPFIAPCYPLEFCIHLGISFPFMTFTSLLSSAICTPFSDNHFAFLHFFFFGMVLVPTSCTILWTSFIVIQVVCLSSVQSLSRVRLFVTPWITARQASLSITNSQSLLKLMPFESVMPSSHLIRCHPLLLLSSIFPRTRVFSNESALCIRWPKYWSFNFNISSSNEHSRLISFRMDRLDLLAVQGTLRSIL